jgi:transcription initiation factor IIE alpha subunit
MKNRFLCPKCRAELKIRDNIIFTGKTETGKRGILLLNQELGNYNLLHEPEFKYKNGEHLHFYCPICQADLGIHDVSEDLAEVIMIDDQDEEYEIIFSVIAGKQCTLKLKDSSIIEKHGSDADEYQNFWGASPSY